MDKTIGQMINELEADIKSINKINAKLDRFKVIYSILPKNEQLKFLKSFMEKNNISLNYLK